MGRKDDHESHLRSLLSKNFDTRVGRKVPTTGTIDLSNEGVYLDAVYLYADMADSSGMARRFQREIAARITQAYLATVTRVLRFHGGEVRSFDGDRVMAIFIGDDAPDKAARAALEIRWAVDNIVHARLDLWLDPYFESSWKISHRTGIDVGEAFIIRGGVRDNNDLASIGNFPNIAAKLSDIKGSRTWITDRLWSKMGYDTCFSFKDGTSKRMWSDPVTRDVGGRNVTVRSSSWGWVIN